MVRSLIKFLQHHWPVLILILLSLGVSAANYVPGTWLLGWDNLAPEFNWSLNVSRALFSAWQEYQGLGLAGGMAHGASLIRESLLWLVSPFFPTSFVRYFWTFAMLVIGPLGVYKLGLDFLVARNEQSTKTAAFLSGLFYLFNLATVQYFYTPFETFSSFYGFLPWLLWALLRLFKENTKRSRLNYFVISLLATSAFQVQTLFVVYVLVSIVFALELWLKERRAALKKIGQWLWLTTAANLFWLVPVIYFTLFHSSINLNAKQNQLSTPELRVMNQNFGGLGDIAALKGYWFEYLDRATGDGHQYLLEPWREYVAQPVVTPILQSLFVAGLLGLVGLAVKKGNKAFQWSWLVVGVGTVLVLTSGAGWLGGLYAWLETHVPLFEQIFRTTFTKWSVVMALLIALGLGTGFTMIAERLNQLAKRILFAGLLIAILVIAPPFFQGKLLYEKMRVDLPEAYLELFEFFADRPKQARVAVLPAEKIFSWDFQDWGYRGSGFIWYGIEQPVLDRAFDVYSAENETFYHQLSEAWQNGTPEELSAVLKRYDVGYVLLDESTLYASSNPKEMLATARQMLENSGYTEIWQKDYLTVFEYPGIAHQDFIAVPKLVESVDLIDPFQSRREFLISPPNFLTSADGQPAKEVSQIFPFISLTKQELSGFEYQKTRAVFNQQLFLQPLTTYYLTLPQWAPGMRINWPVLATLQDNQVTVELPSLFMLKIGEQHWNLPSLGQQVLNLSSAPAEAILTVNEQSIQLQQDQTQTFSAPVRVGQTIRLSANEVLGKNQAGEALVSSANEQALTVPAANWDYLLSSMSSRLIVIGNGATDLSLSLPVAEHDLLPYFRELSALETCDVFGRGQALRELMSNGSILYTASQAGSMCASLGIREIAPGTAYVLYARGENLAGRSLKIGFSGGQRNFFYLENLADKGNFTHAYAVLPQVNPEEEYFLNLETRSFGRDTSQNRLDELKALQLPLTYEWLSQIRLVPENYQPIDNFVELKTTSKWGTAFYLFTAEVQADQGVIAFHQGYDSAWWAIKLNGWPRRLEHFKYNDWANAWILSEGENTVVLIYWPQVGVFAGLALTAITAVKLLKPIFRHGKNSTV